MRELPNLIGQSFERLTVVDVMSRADGSGRLWICRCDCGSEIKAPASRLRNGRVKSCGCYNRDRQTKHGNARNVGASPEYMAWSRIKARCSNPKPRDAIYYRGVTVCERWLSSFENFLEDMGPMPTPKHTIDRYPNGAGNYEPGNCRWATMTEQNRNRSNTTRYLYCGELLTTAEIAEKSGLSIPTLKSRLKKCSTGDEAVALGASAHHVTKEQRHEILSRLQSGDSRKSVASDFGITTVHVGRIYRESISSDLAEPPLSKPPTL